MGLSGFLGQEQAGGLDDHVGADFAPLEVGGVLDGCQTDLLAIDDQGVALDGHIALEAAMHAVVLEHVGQVVGLEQVVDGNDLHVLGKVLHRCAEHHAADATKAIDADFDGHDGITLCVLEFEGSAGAVSPSRSE